MKILPFISLTTLGATIWCAVLVVLGYYFGNPVLSAVKTYSSEASYIIIPLIAWYLWWKIWGEKRQKAKKSSEKSEKNI